MTTKARSGVPGRDLLQARNWSVVPRVVGATEVSPGATTLLRQSFVRCALSDPYFYKGLARLLSSLFAPVYAGPIHFRHWSLDAQLGPEVVDSLAACPDAAVIIHDDVTTHRNLRVKCS